jgi:hypothetical protein
MLLNGFSATIIAILSIFVALILSPWDTASLYTVEDIDATAAVVREKVRNIRPATRRPSQSTCRAFICIPCQ